MGKIHGKIWVHKDKYEALLRGFGVYFIYGPPHRNDHGWKKVDLGNLQGYNGYSIYNTGGIQYVIGQIAPIYILGYMIRLKIDRDHPIWGGEFDEVSTEAYI